MTEATKLLQGSDKDFAVVHSTLTDSKGTAKLWAEHAASRRYRKALLGEARRIDHTLDTLDRIKAQHDALVAALEAAEWAVPTPAADNDGSCPSCYAGKPGYGILATVKFERKNHMKICQLADALEAAE